MRINSASDVFVRTPRVDERMWMCVTVGNDKYKFYVLNRISLMGVISERAREYRSFISVGVPRWIYQPVNKTK